VQQQHPEAEGPVTAYPIMQQRPEGVGVPDGEPAAEERVRPHDTAACAPPFSG
jgi:hypothetical protein